MIFSKLKLIIRSAFYPDRCPFCNKLISSKDTVCDECRRNMPKSGIHTGIPGGYRCVSPLSYTGKYKGAVLRFKFKHKLQHCDRLAEIIYDEVANSYSEIKFDCITFVPMHKKNLSKRGFNQSELLAKSLSRLMDVPCLGTLEKVKFTRPQHILSAKERKTNLKNAFSVIDKNAVSGRSILLIDDIVTTGSTMAECIRTLKKAKPMMICCATLESSQR